jgi:hypothetical protein
MPFYCGKRSAGICVVLGSKQSRPPHHLGGAHKHGATYSSHRAPSTYSLWNERVPRAKRLSWQAWGRRVRQRLGWAGVIGYASGFFEPAASHLPAPPSPRNEGLLRQTPSRFRSPLEQRADLIYLTIRACFSTNVPRVPVRCLLLLAPTSQRGNDGCASLT